MAGVVINSGKTGKLERTFDNEGELYAFVVEWCVTCDEHLVGDVTIGSQDLFTLKAGCVYHVEAGPSGDADGEGYIKVRWLAAD